MPTPPLDSQLASVLSHYPLSEPRVIGALEASKRNDNFVVEDAAGRRYVLRRYRRNNDARRVEFQLRFQRHLLDSGFPTSEVVQTDSGWLFLVSEGYPWALFSYVEGQEYDFSRPAQVAEAARRLAQFHTVAEAFGHEEVVSDLNPNVRQWWTHGEQEIQALQEMFAARGVAVEEEIGFLRRWHIELLREWPLSKLDALPVGWVHGDYHGRNVVFVADLMQGLFDFDVVHRGLKVEDVARGLVFFARQSRGSLSIRHEVARLFLGEYARHRPMSEEERKALPVMAVYDWCPTAPYYAMIERDGEDPALYFRRDVEAMRNLVAEMDALRPLILDSARW